MTTDWRPDFEVALGETFGYYVSPPVPFEDASPHECCEVLWQVVGRGVTPSAIATLVPSEPIVVIREDEPIIERFVEIRDFSTGGRLITVMEVLSLTNKQRGRGRDQYLQKRQELEAAHVHLVEIDLLRGGEPLDPAPRKGLPATRNSPYLVTVIRRVENRATLRCEVYPASMRERLPVIKVPLRPGDEDILLDLQAVLNDAYDRGGYDILDYRQPPVPPLATDDEAWVRQLLSERGLT